MTGAGPVPNYMAPAQNLGERGHRQRSTFTTRVSVRSKLLELSGQSDFQFTEVQFGFVRNMGLENLKIP